MGNVRISGGLRSIVAATTSTALHTISTGLTAVIRKIIVRNHQGANIDLQIGYDTLAAVFTVVLPDLLCLAGMENIWTEDDIPIMGNYPQGFKADTTPVTGNTGIIVGQASAAAAAPADIEVIIEVEEF